MSWIQLRLLQWSLRLLWVLLLVWIWQLHEGLMVQLLLLLLLMLMLVSIV